MTDPSNGATRLGIAILTIVLMPGCTGSDSSAGGSKPINATLTCPIPGKHPPEISTAASFVVGGADCKKGAPAAACRALVMTQIRCTWKDLELGGQTVSDSLWHGQGYCDAPNCYVTEGYDWGTVANGGTYLSRWTETMGPDGNRASWTLESGTGSLEGITGEATLTCPASKPDDTLEVCTVIGSYSLPG